MIRRWNNSKAASSAETEPTLCMLGAIGNIANAAHLVGFGTYELLAGKFLAMIASSASDSAFDLEI